MRSAARLTVVFISILFLCSPAFAEAPIAEIESFYGKVVIMSGTKIIDDIYKGKPLYAGDRIQTEDGKIQIKFKDGAVIKVNPYTSTMIQEKVEVKGFALWKKKVSVRRITCFVGKLWFKSGSSKKKNYLQTPTAVCGVRGSDGDLGFDGIQTYLNMYHGDSDNVGNVLMGFFNNPGQNVAENSEVYKALEKASKEYNKAKGSNNPQKMKKALQLALEAAMAAGEALKDNPDPSVAADAQVLIDQALKELNLLDGAPAVLPPADNPDDEDPCVDICDYNNNCVVGDTEEELQCIEDLDQFDPCDVNKDGEVDEQELKDCLENSPYGS